MGTDLSPPSMSTASLIPATGSLCFQSVANSLRNGTLLAETLHQSAQFVQAPGHEIAIMAEVFPKSTSCDGR